MKPPRKKAETAAGRPSVIDWAEVTRVLDFMAQQGLEEFEYAQGDLRIHLRKPGASGGAVIPFAAPPAPMVVPTAAHAGSGAGEVAPAGAAAQAAEEGLYLVKSPIVGTFYNSPTPGTPPFVKVGDMVAVGKALCIVEAMKLMNEIESDVAGEVARVLVENGQPVEYGQPLFAIRPVSPA